MLGPRFGGVNFPGPLTVDPHAGPAAVCFADQGARAYVADRGHHLVTELNLTTTASGVADVALDHASVVAPTPTAVAFVNGSIFVAHELPGTLSILDSQTLGLIASVATGPRPVTMATDGNLVFVGCAGDDTLRAYDANGQEVGKLALPSGPVAIASVPGAKSVYVVLADDTLLHCQLDDNDDPDWADSRPVPARRAPS